MSNTYNYTTINYTNHTDSNYAIVLIMMILIIHSYNYTNSNYCMVTNKAAESWPVRKR